MFRHWKVSWRTWIKTNDVGPSTVRKHVRQLQSNYFWTIRKTFLKQPFHIYLVFSSFTVTSNNSCRYKVYLALNFTTLLLESISHYDSFFNNFSCDKTHHYEGEQLKDNKQTHSEYNCDNQANQNSKIHTHLARVARLTPF